MQKRVHTRSPHKHSEWTYRLGLRAVLRRWCKDAKQLAADGGHLGPFLKAPGSKKGYDAWIGLDLARSS